MEDLAVTTCPCVGSILIALIATAAFSADDPRDPTRIRGWQDDLDLLVKTIEEKHKNPFTKITKTQFEDAATELRTKIPELQDHQILVGFLRLSAMIGDAHTTVGAGKGGRQFRNLPVGAVWTSEGLFIGAATEEYKDLLRKRVTAIGTTPLHDVESKLATLYATENESGRRDAARRSFVRVEALHALGLIDDLESVPILVEDTKGQRTVRIKPLPAAGQPKFIFAVDHQSKEAPISRRSPRDRYGMEWMQEKKILYCWYDSCQDLPDRPVSVWCDEILKAIDSQPVERLVIDLRRNGGGNSSLAQRLIRGLRTRPQVNQKGTLFVLIGPGTYSSAMQNALQLRQQTQAVLVGLPTGGSPNAFGEINFVDLPYSKWRVQYSTKFFRDTNENVNTVSPDVTIEWTADEYFSGRDPTLERALKYDPK